MGLGSLVGGSPGWGSRLAHGQAATHARGGPAPAQRSKTRSAPCARPECGGEGDVVGVHEVRGRLGPCSVEPPGSVWFGPRCALVSPGDPPSATRRPSPGPASPLPYFVISRSAARVRSSAPYFAHASGRGGACPRDVPRRRTIPGAPLPGNAPPCSTVRVRAAPRRARPRCSRRAARSRRLRD